ncbi:unnamed protein product [Albugo candida]|uniref:Uncharacterized protein n=1 Tax=Albugo candida TaxID=65357 RepID=A0A024GC98_9STRA|nr:unnamed protein product [Albugo candida]|eukprot:CCI43942.1 unnamed protein product [Albugo candida]
MTKIVFVMGRWRLNMCQMPITHISYLHIDKSGTTTNHTQQDATSKLDRHHLQICIHRRASIGGLHKQHLFLSISNRYPSQTLSISFDLISSEITYTLIVVDF